MKCFFRVQSHQACPGQFKGHTVVLQVTYVIVLNKNEYSNNNLIHVCLYFFSFFDNEIINYNANYATFNCHVNNASHINICIRVK